MADNMEMFGNDVATIKMGVNSLSGLYDKGIEKFVKGQKSALKGKSSVIGMAAQNTFEFPVFVSKSVPLDYATATCTLLEQVYASYIQMAISMNPVVDARALKNTTGGGYLSRFKTNTTKYVEYTDASYAHDACHNVIAHDDVITEFDMLSIDDELGELISEMCSYEPLSEFNHFFMEADKDEPKVNGLTHDEYIKKQVAANTDNDSDYKAIQRATQRAERDWLQDLESTERSHQLHVQNTKDQQEKNREEQQARIDQLNSQKDKLDAEIDKLNHEKENRQSDKEEQTARIDQLKAQKAKIEQELKDVNAADVEENKFLYDLDDNGNLIKHRQFTADEELYDRRRKAHNDAERSKYDTAVAKKDAENYDERLQNERNREARERMAKAPEIMDETKIRKLNSLKPLMMRCQIRVSDKTGRITEYPVELICGVKVHCRMIDASVLPDVVKFPLKEMNRLTRDIRFRAGELKFFRDVVFNIKEKKQTAIDSRDPNHKWYRRLYQLAHMKGDSIVSQRISGNGSSGLIPNAALIITNNDVENVKAETDIDVLKGSVGCKLCKELFMMALIVIDQDQESVKMLTPDINSDYEVHSMASINKQLAELDTAGTKTRDIFKLLG